MSCTIYQCPLTPKHQLKWTGRDVQEFRCDHHFNMFVPPTRRKGTSEGAKFEWVQMEMAA